MTLPVEVEVIALCQELLATCETRHTGDATRLTRSLQEAGYRVEDLSVGLGGVKLRRGTGGPLFLVTDFGSCTELKEKTAITTVRITCEVPNIPTNTQPEILKQLIRDALNEFIQTRTPIEQYVQRRYPDGYLGDKKNNQRKAAQIASRIDTAKSVLSSFELVLDNEV